jgi:type II secretory pathway pseudopilin PulG
MDKTFKFFMDNRGITLIEIIVALALMMLIIPIAWNFMNSSVKDTATINNKVAVQSSVNALMTQLQRDIQEARCPINSNNENYVGIDENGKIGIKEEGFIIRKPGADENPQSVSYEFDAENKKVVVTSGLRLKVPTFGSTEFVIDEENSNKVIAEYDFIKEFTLKRVGDNGVEVYIRGEIDSKSGYTLTNTYYTRNTI